MADYAAANGFDLTESVAYADSTSDLPMLDAVGFPVAVNPETRLAALARKRGWLVEHFDTSRGAPHRLLPIGPTWGGGGTGLMDRLARLLAPDVSGDGNGNGRGRGPAGRPAATGRGARP
jgi:hypothetical protein